MIGEMHYDADRERPSRVERLFLSSPDSFGQSLLSGLTLFASPLAFRSSRILSRGISIRKSFSATNCGADVALRDGTRVEGPRWPKRDHRGYGWPRPPC